MMNNNQQLRTQLANQQFAQKRVGKSNHCSKQIEVYQQDFLEISTHNNPHFQVVPGISAESSIPESLCHPKSCHSFNLKGTLSIESKTSISINLKSFGNEFRSQINTDKRFKYDSQKRLVNYQPKLSVNNDAFDKSQKSYTKQFKYKNKENYKRNNLNHNYSKNQDQSQDEHLYSNDHYNQKYHKNFSKIKNNPSNSLYESILIEIDYDTSTRKIKIDFMQSTDDCQTRLPLDNNIDDQDDERVKWQDQDSNSDSIRFINAIFDAKKRKGHRNIYIDLPKQLIDRDWVCSTCFKYQTKQTNICACGKLGKVYFSY